MQLLDRFLDYVSVKIYGPKTTQPIISLNELVNSEQKSAFRGVITTFIQKYPHAHNARSEDHIMFSALKSVAKIVIETVDHLKKKGFSEKAIKGTTSHLKIVLKGELDKLLNSEDQDIVFLHLVSPGIDLGVNIALAQDRMVKTKESSETVNLLDQIVDLAKVYCNFRALNLNNYKKHGKTKESHVKLYHQLLQQMENVQINEQIFEIVYEKSYSYKRPLFS